MIGAGYPVLFDTDRFVFNEHRNVDGTLINANIDDTVVIDEVAEPAEFRDVSDVLHLDTGGSFGRVHKGPRHIPLVGRILVPNATQQGRLADREREMRAAFDPSLCLRDSPTTYGAFPLDFLSPTLDTTNWVSGVIPLRYYCRPIREPQITHHAGERSSPFRLDLLAADPRAYDQSESTLTLSPATASGNATNLGNSPTPLMVTITMAGAGHASFMITRAGVAFVLNLSGCTAGNVVVVVMGAGSPYGRGRYITKAGVEAFSLKTSVASSWLDVPTGTTSFAITNHTNVTSCVLAWRNAFA